MQKLECISRRIGSAAVLLLFGLTMFTQAARAQYPSGPQIIKDGTTVNLQDYASLPLSSATTGTYPPPIDFSNQLGRVNFLRSEPANAPQSPSRFFVNDLNSNLYILDKASLTFTSYINFAEVFPKFVSDPGFAGGLVTFVFDPDYAHNGKFYTVHTEDPSKSGSAVPINTNLPGLDLSGGYTTTTTVIPPAGTVAREAVLVEWTDTNVNDATFQGTAREILRLGFNDVIHPMGDLIFNPLAVSGQSDYRNLYISVGDGAAGETAGVTHTIPQRLDALQGKILRITPDISINPADPLGANGRYRIPATGSDPNPFVSASGAKGEIYAYGLRNPHRMSWDSVSNTLIVDTIGLSSWEAVDIITKGANYGWAEREGIEQVFIGGTNNWKTGSQTSPPTPFPSPDTLTVAGIATPVTPIYPVAEYSHQDGDSISSGFVYRGALMPQLYGKYIFGDITTGRLFYADLGDMIANNDGVRTTLAAAHEIQVVYNSPYNTQGAVNRRLYDIVADAYKNKGGNPGDPPYVLPGGATNVLPGHLDPYGVPYSGGRADTRIAMGGDGEIYILSKSDGFIRELTSASAAPPAITNVAASSITTSGATIGWTTNLPANSQVEYGTTPSYGNVTPLDSNQAMNHSEVLAGLAVGTLYHYRVDSTNGLGLKSMSGDFTFTTATTATTIVTFDDLSSPGRVLTGQYPTGVINWGTGTSWYLSGPWGKFTTNSISFNTSKQTSGSFTFIAPDSLLSLQAYNGGTTSSTVTISCSGQTSKQTAVAAGTIATINTGWTVACSPVTIASTNGWNTNFDNLTVNTPTSSGGPTITSVAAGSITTSGATISWTTNVVANSQVEYGTTTGYGTFSTLNSSLVTSHSVALAALSAGTLYHYRVHSTDGSGNAAVSGDFTFTTVALPTITNVAAGSITSSGATITWTTNVTANSQVEYGTTIGYGTFSTLNPSLVTSHSVALTALTASTPYHYRVHSTDGSGNAAVSGDFTFTTTSGSAVTTTVTFDDISPANRVLSGQYPTGLINWGTGTSWWLSSAWGLFTTQSISFNGASLTSVSFAFVSSSHLVSIQAYNGGTGSSTITISCTGQTTATATVAAGVVSTINTNWTTPCTTVTIKSSNGWNTNFDNMVVSTP